MVVGGFDNDSLISQFAVYPLDMNIYHQLYHVGFITSVYVHIQSIQDRVLWLRLCTKSPSHMREKRGQSMALYILILYHCIVKFGWWRLFPIRFLI